MRNLFYAFCHKNEKNSTCRYCWSCKIVWIHIQVLYKVWSLEINLGYMVTILKRKCRVLTGKHRTHHEYRKCISQKQMWIMLFIFFDIQGIVQVEFMPRGTNVNTEYYKGLLECLQNNMQWKRPEKWKNRFVLHHDNALCHTSVVIHQFLADKNYRVPSSWMAKGTKLM